MESMMLIILVDIFQYNEVLITLSYHHIMRLPKRQNGFLRIKSPI